VTAAYWAWRSAVIPGAAQVTLDADALARVGRMVLWTVSLAGESESRRLFLWVCGIAVGAAFLSRTGRLRRAVWLVAAIAPAAAGSVEARPNLLFLSVFFYSLFLGSVSVAAMQRYSWTRVPVTLLLVWLTVTAAGASRLEQVSMHPLSTDQVYRDWHFIYGPLRHATIPPARRAFLEAKLQRLGVTDPAFDFDRWEETVVAAGGSPAKRDALFVPVRRFLEP
jgi:hypothetical protein